MTLQESVIDGRVVRYADEGDRSSRRVLVLIHAFPMGAQMWEAQCRAFDGWRVVAPALPGFDGSDRRVEASVDAYSDQVLDLLDALHVERAVVCGLSMGGYVTFALLRRAQDRVSGIVLADTRSTADSPEILRMREGMLERLQGGGASAVAVDMQPKLFGPATYRKRPAVIASVRQFIERQPPDAIADAIRAMMTRPDSGALLSSLRMPALVIVGEDDVMTPPSDAEGMHAAIAGSSLVRLPGVGHMSNLEDPHAFNAAVADFLRGLKPKA